MNGPELAPSLPPSNGLVQDAPYRKILVCWEFLRCIYNVVMSGFGFLMCLHMLGRPPELGFFLLFGVIANILFCLGPYMELLIGLFSRAEHPFFRIMLFLAGLLFSGCVIFLVLTTQMGSQLD
jgi:hypothetical protein